MLLSTAIDLLQQASEILMRCEEAPTPPAAIVVEDYDLPPRIQETLSWLLRGDSEKQIAARMGLSIHTVHVYVKHIYRKCDVCSRGELMARFVDRTR